MNIDLNIIEALKCSEVNMKTYKNDIIEVLKKADKTLKNIENHKHIRTDKHLRNGLNKLKKLYDDETYKSERWIDFLMYLIGCRLVTNIGADEIKLIILSYRKQNNKINERVKKRFKEFINSLENVITDKEHIDNKHFINIKEHIGTMHKNDIVDLAIHNITHIIVINELENITENEIIKIKGIEIINSKAKRCRTYLKKSIEIVENTFRNQPTQNKRIKGLQELILS
ncbi:hypothetical protein AN286_02665 [Aliarcobacter cryaerophilus ATCC 43158]|uniref:Uncharacterized protein n=1 Tax=Aliarcobacter cryaerophilus ATCC 43158 TaxID=1032070 RepID=A0AAD0XAB4_9BACT|nr:hypothetical protein [Aliarcobacter cryaerophilus]AYJ81040.1 hypothetical protein ACRYA_1951 [Aliarcobacter cryaerophilus ATCC 43158]PRM96492.1 hypothetical protein CJ667_07635 [Aliarcobacter cryaerophilus]QCZ23358.1 hypothetical protein AN286_02665 [Aliarcobacter cryaerophilus ATCC 43158]